LYAYTCMPFGLCVAPWVYTKLNKPIISYLRTIGIVLVSYLDDTLIINRDLEEIKKNLNVSMRLFQRLGLMINTKKSQLEPSNSAIFLGFYLDSTTMQMTLPNVKKNRVISKCRLVLDTVNLTVLQLSELIDMLVAASPATTYGMLYTKQLEVEKTEMLLANNGSYNVPLTLSHEAKNDIPWWINNIDSEFRDMRPFIFNVEIFSDASPLGWGAVCNGIKAQGSWTVIESKLHINILELLAAFHALKSFIKTTNICVLLRVDNCNALAYINNYGGCRSKELHKIAMIFGTGAREVILCWWHLILIPKKTLQLTGFQELS